MLTCARENIVALCDVDHTFAAKTFKAFPNAKVYKASADFDYSGPLTELALLGNIAKKFPNQKLLLDNAQIKVTNLDEANEWVRRPYRKGWSL